MYQHHRQSNWEGRLFDDWRRTGHGGDIGMGDWSGVNHEIMLNALRPCISDHKNRFALRVYYAVLRHCVIVEGLWQFSMDIAGSNCPNLIAR
jgi:hypothetical protein